MPVIYRDEPDALGKIAQLRRLVFPLDASSPSSLHDVLILVDFDFTITVMYDENRNQQPSCYGMLETCPPLNSEECVARAQSLYRKYIPFHGMATSQHPGPGECTVAVKEAAMREWTTQSLENLKSGRLTRRGIRDAVQRAHPILRSGYAAFVDFARTHRDLEVVVFSAGITDVILEVFHYHGMILGSDETQRDVSSSQPSIQNISVHSNSLQFHNPEAANPEDEVLVAWGDDIYHPMNKNAHRLLAEQPNLKKKKCIIVLGDSLDDIKMSSGFVDTHSLGGAEFASTKSDQNTECTILNIAFVNDPSPENVRKYCEIGWDIVLTEENASFSFLQSLFVY